MRRSNLLLGVLSLLALVWYCSVGSTGWWSWGDPNFRVVFWEIRLPRGLLAWGVGMILGSVGCAFQALLRNPLADPFVVGVSSGAGAGGAFAVALGFAGALGGLGMVAAAFAGGLGSLWLVFRLARRRGQVELGTLLLAGVTIGSLLSAVLAFTLLLAGQDQVRVLGFLLGHTSDASWPKVAVMSASSLGFIYLARQARRLNAMAMGDAAAVRLGVDAPRLLRGTLLVGTAMTAAAVGAVGVVGFVGLLGPHLARRWVGVDWRRALPASAWLGGGLMLLADLIGQRALPLLTGTAGMEVNVGIVAALLGAPALLALLRRE